MTTNFGIYLITNVAGDTDDNCDDNDDVDDNDDDNDNNDDNDDDIGINQFNMLDMVPGPGGFGER